jgi:aromatase
MTADTGRAMTTSDIEEVLITKCGVEKDAFAKGEEQPLEDLGVDSLAVLELQGVVQDRVGVKIPDPDEAVHMSVTEIAGYIDEATGG